MPVPDDGAVMLPALACASVRGADATVFLHGQFCADLLAIQDGAACLTAWCTPQGRVLTTLFAARAGEGWTLVLPADIAPDIVQRLRRYVLRSRVEVQPGHAAVPLFGLGAGPAARLAAGIGWQVFPVPRPVAAGRRYLACARELPADAANAAIDRAGSRIEPRDWLRENVDAGMPWVDAGTSGLFLPQELDLERWDGLSYSKGCYPGQEIVARLRYRGTVKRGLFRLGAPPAALATLGSGARLLDGAGKAVGTVLYTGAGADEEIPVLAVVDLGLPAQCVLHAHDGTPLRITSAVAPQA